MTLIRPLRDRFVLLARSEQGMALPTAIFAMIASLGLASAAVLSSVDVQQGTARDHDSKEAIAAADAGAGVALLRLNRFQGNLGPTKPCVGPAGETLAATGGWCPATTPESVGEAIYSYRVSAYSPTGALSVVAVGTSNGVSRRVNVGLISYGPKNIFIDEKLIGQEGIDVVGTPYIDTDIGTNGDVTGKGHGTFCGNIRHGPGKEAPEPDCGGKKTEGEKNLPEVAPPEDIATNNSNCRLALTCSIKTDIDTYSTSNEKKEHRTSTKPWDAKNRTINVASNARLTLSGGDYFVCGLFINNGELIMAAGKNVRIFVDTPENCGLSAGATQVEITGNASISSTAYVPQQGTYAVPGIYVIGSLNIPTTVKLSGNSANIVNELVLYAPHSDVILDGSATWKGMIAGNSLTLKGTPRVESDPEIMPPDTTVATLLQRTRYVECTGATASPPDASC